MRGCCMRPPMGAAPGCCGCRRSARRIASRQGEGGSLRGPSEQDGPYSLQSRREPAFLVRTVPWDSAGVRGAKAHPPCEAIMNLSWMSVFVFFLAIPWQVNNEKVCDHAAPPPGMRWQCSETNKCDCRLVPRAGGNGLDEEGRAGRAEPAPYLACRLLYFVLPEYPEAARKAQKQGTVSAILILNGAGAVGRPRPGQRGTGGGEAVALHGQPSRRKYSDLGDF